MSPPTIICRLKTTTRNGVSAREGQPRAILFDLDGTLIDTTELIIQCFEFSWTTVCGFSLPRETLIETFGIPLRDAMHRLLARRDSNGSHDVEPDKDTVDKLVASYRLFNTSNHDLMARPFEGARETLTELRRRGYLISVVTSKGRDLGLRGLRLCSLENLLDSAVFLEDTSVHKPHPDPILVALERLHAASSAAVYVGDSPHDMIAARAAGVRTAAALWGPSPRSELESEQPTYAVESITDLLEIFN